MLLAKVLAIDDFALKPSSDTSDISLTFAFNSLTAETLLPQLSATSYLNPITLFSLSFSSDIFILSFGISLSWSSVTLTPAN